MPCYPLSCAWSRAQFSIMSLAQSGSWPSMLSRSSRKSSTDSYGQPDPPARHSSTPLSTSSQSSPRPFRKSSIYQIMLANLRKYEVHAEPTWTPGWFSSKAARMSSSVGQPFLSLTGTERADVASRRTQRTFIFTVFAFWWTEEAGKLLLYHLTVTHVRCTIYWICYVALLMFVFTLLCNRITHVVKYHI